ncbi:MAG: hypothetical protein ACR2ME_09980 [Acidimicrobiia bacterium]
MTLRTRSARKIAFVLALTAVFSCGNDPATVQTAPASVATSVATTAALEAHTPGTSSPTPRSGCAPFEGAPFDSLATADSAVLAKDLGEISLIEAVVYPRPDYKGKPWTSWGQGFALADGRFLSSIGDHLGAEGNSYVYEFDPASGVLTMIADVNSLAGPQSWGFGKVHGQTVEGPCGELYFSTYWGDHPSGDVLSSYEGDLLFRIDPAARTIQPIGVPVAGHGVPSLSGSTELGLLYGEAVDPAIQQPKDGPFFVYDVNQQKTVFATDVAAPHQGFRHIAVDAEGRAYFSGDDYQLLVYDPATGEVSPYPTMIPGLWLRASTVPAEDGTMYATTREPDMLFSFHPDGTVRDFGPAPDYTASLALDPDGSRFFYIPSAHGRAWALGTPLISVDVATGDQTTLVELNDLGEEGLGLSFGGTYGIVASAEGDRLYIVLNSGVPGNERDAAFGEVVLVIVHLA